MARVRKNRRRGAVVVETALVIPLFFIFMLGLFEFARVAMIRQVMDAAAREGVRLAVVSTQTLSTAQIQATVTSYLCGQNVQNLSIQVYKADPTSGANIDVWTNAKIGDCIAVQVTGNYVPMVRTISLIPNPLPLQAKAMLYSEAN
ncbi:MAG: TadE/TadG family type IV pilus assembly protein [Thermoguttaceae bacterium]|jgi:Flp pilus assembly protein TadG